MYTYVCTKSMHHVQHPSHWQGTFLENNFYVLVYLQEKYLIGDLDGGHNDGH